MRILAILAATLILLSPAYAKKAKAPAPKPPVEKEQCFSMDDVIGMAKETTKLIARLEGDSFLVFKTRVAEGHDHEVPKNVDSILVFRKTGVDSSLVVTFEHGCQNSFLEIPNKTINKWLEDNSF